MKTLLLRDNLVSVSCTPRTAASHFSSNFQNLPFLSFSRLYQDNQQCNQHESPGRRSTLMIYQPQQLPGLQPTGGARKMQQLSLTVIVHSEKMDKSIPQLSSSPRHAPHPDLWVGIPHLNIWILEKRVRPLT